MSELHLPLSLLDDLSDAVVVVDAQDRVRLWSERAASLLGPSASECVGRPLVELIQLGGEPLPLGPSVNGRQLYERLRALREALDEKAPSGEGAP